MIEDGNCAREIVAMCLLISEEKDNLLWFINTFKEKNSNFHRTRTIMTDKDLTERCLLKAAFPNANLILCVFHTLKTFRREITCEKLGITQSQRLQTLEVLQELVYAKIDTQFLQLYEKLKHIAPKVVLDYYHKNWHEIKHERNVSSSFLKSNFLNNTNNRLECLNSKLKSVISKNSSLEEFLKSFFTIVQSLEDKRDYDAVCRLQKRRLHRTETNSEIIKYENCLTKEAGKHVLRQFEKLKISRMEKKLVATVMNRYSYNNHSVLTTTLKCECSFFTAMLLPCQHIFLCEEKGKTFIF